MTRLCYTCGKEHGLPEQRKSSLLAELPPALLAEVDAEGIRLASTNQFARPFVPTPQQWAAIEALGLTPRHMQDMKEQVAQRVTETANAGGTEAPLPDISDILTDEMPGVDEYMIDAIKAEEAKRKHRARQARYRRKHRGGGDAP